MCSRTGRPPVRQTARTSTAPYAPHAAAGADRTPGRGGMSCCGALAGAAGLGLEAGAFAGAGVGSGAGQGTPLPGTPSVTRSVGDEGTGWAALAAGAQPRGRLLPRIGATSARWRRLLSRPTASLPRLAGPQCPSASGAPPCGLGTCRHCSGLRRSPPPPRARALARWPPCALFTPVQCHYPGQGRETRSRDGPFLERPCEGW